jgi:hypothetical protein
MDPNFKFPAIFAETSEPATPSSGNMAIYAAADKTLRYKTDAGLVVNLTQGVNTTTTVNANSATWSSAYTTVNANSATWGGSVSSDGLTIFKQVSSTASPNNVRTVHALTAISTVDNIDAALIAKGTGATLAQISDGSESGGNKRGIYATDWQKLRAAAGEVASGENSVISGGINNTASNTSSTVGGGNGNAAAGIQSVIAGGYLNSTSNTNACIGGGKSNIASGVASAVGGGDSNTSSNTYSFVGGGVSNVASGVRSSILGGQSNNTNSLNNAHIIGSNITASLADYTFVNNLSSQGIVAATGGNSNNWNSTYTSFASQSANNASVYSTVNSNSASWATVQSLVFTESTASLAITSGNTVSLSSLATNVAVLTGNFATTNNTTLQNVDGLSFFMEPNTRYYFECYIQYTANATTTGSELGITGPASPTIVLAQGYIANSTAAEGNSLATAYGAVTTNANSGGATARNARVNGFIYNGANAGNLTVQTKVESGVTGTVTYLANSFLVWYKLKA